jgi:hypothetical protein
MPEYIRWQANQGGFHVDAHYLTLDTLKSVFRKKHDISWDGTFNMPIMPVANNRHKHMKSIYGVPV